MSCNLHFDVVIVGAGPAGLSFAINLARKNKDISIAVFEKSNIIGGNTISGAVVNGSVLDRVSPMWKDDKDLISSISYVKKENIVYLGKKSLSIKLPVSKNKLLVSISSLCKHLFKIAESLGVNVFTGISIKETLFDSKNKVIGVKTKEFGVDDNGKRTSRFLPEEKIFAEYSVLAEGCCGVLSEGIIKRYNLRKNTPSNALGIKEMWSIEGGHKKEGEVYHFIGYPFNDGKTGGAFLYYLANNKVALGIVADLFYDCYEPSPFTMLKKFKSHSNIKNILAGNRRISYGARILSKGGLYSQARFNFPGGFLIGDSAGVLDPLSLNGIENSIESSFIVSDFLADNLNKKAPNNDFLTIYKKTKLYKSLNRSKNFSLYIKRYGMIKGIIYASLNKYMFFGISFNKKSNRVNKKVILKDNSLIDYDYFNMIESSIFYSNLKYSKQPSHISINTSITKANRKYLMLEKLCPAGVYRVFKSDTKWDIRVYPTQCLHCKACSIKTFNDIITWTIPEGGSGPGYRDM